MTRRLVVWGVVAGVVGLVGLAAYGAVELARSAVEVGREQGRACVWDCVGQGYATGVAVDDGGCECDGDVDSLCDDEALEERRRARAMGISR